MMKAHAPHPSSFILHPLSLLLLLLAGCGGAGYQLAPVSGRVTLHEKPLAGVHVSFQPVALGAGSPNPGPGSFGQTDADGRFTLRTMDTDRPGAVVGNHVVTLSTASQQSGPSDAVIPAESLLPKSAGDGSLRFEVPAGGTDQANFAF